MSPFQQDIFNEAESYVRGAIDVLERHENRLRSFGDAKADESDPYSIDVNNVADSICFARGNLTDALGLMRVFSENDGSGVAAQ